LIETYVEKADDLEMVRANIVPALLEAVLLDYNRNVPGARDAEVLKVMSTIITKLSALMEDQVPTIMENVFECTLEMINKDFSEFPDHRVEFFSLLRSINLHCFPGKFNSGKLFGGSANSLKLFSSLITDNSSLLSIRACGQASMTIARSNMLVSTCVSS